MEKELKMARVINYITKLVGKNREKLENVDLVVGLGPNGMIPAVMVTKLLGNKPLGIVIDKNPGIDVAAYVENVPKVVLIVADFVNTGKTMSEAVQAVQDMYDSDVLTFAVGHSLESSHKPTVSMKSKKKLTFPWTKTTD